MSDLNDYEPYGGFRRFCIACIRFVVWFIGQSIYACFFLLGLLLLILYLLSIGEMR